MNLASKHYKENIIREYKISNYTTTDRENVRTGVFKCSCGFIYKRVGPDVKESDRYRYNSVVEYGEEWEARLGSLWKDLTLSLKRIAQNLGVSELSVTRHAIRLSLPMNEPNSRKVEGYVNYRNPNDTFRAKVINYRFEWEILIGKYPHLSRTELMNKAKFLYKWLRENDSAWFEKRLPTQIKNYNISERLDWKKIDLELSKEIEKVCLEIIALISFPARVSITEIIRRVGRKNWIEKRKGKLPFTCQILDKHLESRETYMLRKIQLVKSEFINERKIPTVAEFKIKAVLKNKTSKESLKIKLSLELAIKELRSLFNSL